MANALKDELIYNCGKEYSELKSKGDKGAYVTFFIDRIVPVIYPGKPKEMNRKSVIRLLNRVLSRKPPMRPGCKKTYFDIDCQSLKAIWPVMGFMCGKRLKRAMKDWVEFFDFSPEIKKKLLAMSPATIKRKKEVRTFLLSQLTQISGKRRSAPFSPENSCALALKHRESFSATYEQLGLQMAAVHATDLIPENDV